jgi:hypothetical protein
MLHRNGLRSSAQERDGGQTVPLGSSSVSCNSANAEKGELDTIPVRLGRLDGRIWRRLQAAERLLDVARD